MLSIIIPLREGSSAEVTLRSLASQSFQDYEVILSQDDAANANSARNRGYLMARGEYLLFSDDDIQWKPDALMLMMEVLRGYSTAAYCYGSYKMADRIYCTEQFNADLLRRKNYISTMSIIRRKFFPGFDESLERLQDWALWLDMLNRGHTGVNCGHLVFETEKKNTGITFGGKISYQQAERIVLDKYVRGASNGVG